MGVYLNSSLTPFPRSCQKRLWQSLKHLLVYCKPTKLCIDCTVVFLSCLYKILALTLWWDDSNNKCKKFFTFFIIVRKNAFFNVFYFLECFLFSSEIFFYPTKSAKILLSLLSSCIKRLLSDGLNMTFVSYENSLMKSCRA